MSQKKMEAYKEAKKNKRQIEKKQKRNRILGWIFGILIATAVIGGSVYLVYYSSVILPKKQAEQTQEVTDSADGETVVGEDENTTVVPVDPSELQAEESTPEDTQVTDDETVQPAEEAPADETSEAAETEDTAQ